MLDEMGDQAPTLLQDSAKYAAFVEDVAPGELAPEELQPPVAITPDGSRMVLDVNGTYPGPPSEE